MYNLPWYISGALAFNSLFHIPKKAEASGIGVCDSKAIQITC